MTWCVPDIRGVAGVIDALNAGGRKLRKRPLFKNVVMNPCKRIFCETKEKS